MEVGTNAHSLGGAPLMVNINTLSRSAAANKVDGWFECVLLWQVPLPNDVLRILAVIKSRQDVWPPCLKDGSNVVFARPLFFSSTETTAFSVSGLARPRDVRHFAPLLPEDLKCVQKAPARWFAQ